MGKSLLPKSWTLGHRGTLLRQLRCCAAEGTRLLDGNVLPSGVFPSRRRGFCQSFPAMDSGECSRAPSPMWLLRSHWHIWELQSRQVRVNYFLWNIGFFCRKKALVYGSSSWNEILSYREIITSWLLFFSCWCPENCSEWNSRCQLSQKTEARKQLTLTGQLTKFTDIWHFCNPNLDQIVLLCWWEGPNPPQNPLYLSKTT